MLVLLLPGAGRPAMSARHPTSEQKLADYRNLLAPPALQKHIFSNLFFECFFNGFLDAFWSDSGFLLGAFLTQISMLFSIKNWVDFLVAFLTPLGWILGPPTLQN